MAALTGTQIKATYGDVLQCGNAGAGITAAVQIIQDGLGNNTALGLSTTVVRGNIFRGPDGSQGTPTYSFTGATGTGIFCGDDSSGQVGITSVGTWIVNLNNSVGIRIRGDSAAQNLGWCSGGPNTAHDTIMSRAAAGVIQLKKSDSSLVTFLQQTAGECALTAAFTDATGTLAATNLSVTVASGRSYRVHAVLQVSNSTAAEGVQLDFAGGSATATTFFATASAIGSVVAGTVVSTSLAGVINYTTITGTDYIVINGYLKCNAAGTIILRAAENTTATGTMTLGAGSFLALTDIRTV